MQGKVCPVTLQLTVPVLSKRGQYLHLKLLQTFLLLLFGPSVEREGVGDCVVTICVKSLIEDVEVILRSPSVFMPCLDINSLIVGCFRAVARVGVGDCNMSQGLVAATLDVFNVTSALTSKSLRFLGRL